MHNRIKGCKPLLTIYDKLLWRIVWVRVKPNLPTTVAIA